MQPLSSKELERFWAHVAVAGPNDCWNWQSCKTGGKALGWYGRVSVRGKKLYSHRVAFCAGRGYPMEYLTPDHAVMHSCDNHFCCNPAHVEIGTQLQNVKDMISKGRHRSGTRRRRTPAVEVPV